MGEEKPFGGRVALVTGASSGIGRAAAEMFAARGAAVVVAARDLERGRETVERIHAAGGQASLIEADMERTDDIARLFERTEHLHGRLDFAFNNAGTVGDVGPFHEQTLEAWSQVITTNLTAVFLCMQAEIRLMLKSGGGRIVNNGSGASVMAAPGMPHYTAAKHGVLGLTKVAAREYGPQGIRVNAICPGFIDTPQMARFLGSPEARAAVDSSIPLGAMGSPDDVAKAVMFLCSDDAAYISGDTMFVDGAYLAR